MTVFPNTWSPNLHIPLPIETDTPPDLPAVCAAQIAVIDHAATILSGTFASMSSVCTAAFPAGLPNGLLYQVSDSTAYNGLLFEWNSITTSWQVIQLGPTVQSLSGVTPNLGQFTVVLAGQTANLPSPVPNMMITLQADVGVSGANPAIFTADHVVGKYINGAMAYTMGVPGATMQFIGDGTYRWRVVSGQQETGWVPILSLMPTGTQTADPFLDPAMCLEGNKVTMRGAVIFHPPGDELISSIFTVPAQFLPPTDTSYIFEVNANWENNPNVFPVTIADGVFQFDGEMSANNMLVSFDSISYTVN